MFQKLPELMRTFAQATWYRMQYYKEMLLQTSSFLVWESKNFFMGVLAFPSEPYKISYKIDLA